MKYALRFIALSCLLVSSLGAMEKQEKQTWANLYQQKPHLSLLLGLGFLGGLPVGAMTIEYGSTNTIDYDKALSSCLMGIPLTAISVCLPSQERKVLVAGFLTGASLGAFYQADCQSHNSCYESSEEKEVRTRAFLNRMFNRR